MTLILMRHGQSEANYQNIFTGWLDFPLTEVGVKQAHRVGQLLLQENIHFDAAFTSVLSRGILSTTIVLEDLHQLAIPVTKSWRLNERHYGAWQGLNKAELATIYGAEELEKRRRSFKIAPPVATTKLSDRRYQNAGQDIVPLTESLADTLVRVLPLWQDQIAPLLLADKNVLIVTHGNTMRALMKYIESISDEAIEKISVATGDAIWYEFGEGLTVTNRWSV